MRRGRSENLRIDRADAAPLPGDESKGPFGSRFNHRDYGWFVRRLKTDPDEWFSSEDILQALEAYSREPIPEEFATYLKRRLDREVPKPRGRKPGGSVDELRHLLIRLHYRRNLDWLEARGKSGGLEGWSLIPEADWWQGPPSERAARMVKERYGRSITWQRVRKIALGD
jgi:hypothetical protein